MFEADTFDDRRLVAKGRGAQARIVATTDTDSVWQTVNVSGKCRGGVGDWV
jgi:hypothetical protein